MNGGNNRDQLLKNFPLILNHLLQIAPNFSNIVDASFVILAFFIFLQVDQE